MTQTAGLSFFALFALMILGAFLAVLIYSIVAKRFWLTGLVLMLPVGLVLVLGILIANYRMKAIASLSQENYSHAAMLTEAETSQLKADDNLSIPDVAWTDTLPPTADIYPSIDLCGRPLAFQVAEGLRKEKRENERFAVTFEKERRPGDRDQWNPPRSFVTNFRVEFVKQFPGSTVVAPIKAAEVKAEADPAYKDLQPVKIKLSFKLLENPNNDKPTAGTISARWTSRDKTRAVASIDFVDQPWVTYPDQFVADNASKAFTVGLSQQLARSPAEATTLALQDANRRRSDIAQITPHQIVDRFTQKFTLPYGELWQEAVLVDQRIQPTLARDSGHQDKARLVRNSDSAAPTEIVRNDRHSGQHSKHRRFLRMPELIITLIGLVLIGWISNVLTQGYYRQNIQHILITGVAVLFGLTVLALVLSA